jgi:thiamine phosphate synthase YjbQ (UPF0047 family)
MIACAVITCQETQKGIIHRETMPKVRLKQERCSHLRKHVPEEMRLNHKCECCGQARNSHARHVVVGQDELLTSRDIFKSQQLQKILPANILSKACVDVQK